MKKILFMLLPLQIFAYDFPLTGTSIFQLTCNIKNVKVENNELLSAQVFKKSKIFLTPKNKENFSTNINVGCGYENRKYTLSFNNKTKIRNLEIIDDILTMQTVN